MSQHSIAMKSLKFWLFLIATTGVQDVLSAGEISAIGTTVQTTGDPFKWLYDCDYLGNDLVIINNGNTNSSILCAEACFNNNNCNFFTFSSKTTICSLKKLDDVSNISKKIIRQGSICGLIEKRIKSSMLLHGRQWQKSADGSYAYSQTCSFTNYDIGYDTFIDTYDLCAQHCKARPEPCTHFVLDSSFCYFKKITGSVNVEDYSYDPVRYKNLLCGFLISPQSIVNPVAEFNIMQHQVSSSATDIAAIGAPVQTSGDSSFKWMYDCDYKGSDIYTFSNGTNSLMRCAEACFNNNNCSLFTFNSKSIICSLKKVVDTGKKIVSQGSICGLIEKRIPPFKQPKVGTISEEHRKWTVTQDGSYQWSQGCTFFGYDTVRIDRVNNVDECAQPCSARKEQCTHFVFNSNDKSCILKKVNNYPYITAQDDQPSNIFCGFTLASNDNSDFNNVESIMPLAMPKGDCTEKIVITSTSTETAATISSFEYDVIE